MSLNRIKYKYKISIVTIIYILLVFQMALQESKLNHISTFFKYYDDLLVLILGLKILHIIVLHKKIVINEYKILIIVITLCILGLISSILYEFQSYKAVVSDFLTCLRFSVALCGAYLWTKNNSNYNQILQQIVPCTKLIIVLLFILVINEMFIFPIFEVWDFRFFTNSTALFFPHPSYLVASSIVLMCIITLSLQKNKKNIIYLFMCSIIILSTMRSKGIAYIGVYWLLYITIIEIKVKKKILIYIASTVGAILIGYTQIIYYYFSNTWSARQVMLQDAFTIAMKHFPIGSGFATFGSNAAVEYYSPLYSLFGYNAVYGMSNETAMYLTDGFWPLVIAQFGFFSIPLIVYMIIVMFKMCNKCKKEKFGYITMLSIVMYMVIATFGELAFFSPYAAIHFSIFGIIYSNNRTMRRHYVLGEYELFPEEKSTLI